MIQTEKEKKWGSQMEREGYEEEVRIRLSQRVSTQEWGSNGTCVHGKPRSTLSDVPLLEQTVLLKAYGGKHVGGCEPTLWDR